MLETLMQMMGRKPKQQPEQPILLRPYEGKPGAAAGGVVRGANREAYLRYVEEMQNKGENAVPFNAWVKQQNAR